MGQIMRLRRIAGSDFTSRIATTATATSTRSSRTSSRNGLLHEADLLPDSYGGKFHPRAVPELIASLPIASSGLLRGKITPAKALLHPHKASKELRAIFETDREQAGALRAQPVRQRDRRGQRASQSEPKARACMKVAYWPAA